MRDPSIVERATSAVTAVVDELKGSWPRQVSVAAAVRAHHANSVTWHPPQPPDAVFFAASTEDVQAVVRLCAAHRVPIIPFGTGTSLEGQINAPLGGVSIDLSRMNAILSVDATDLTCSVQAGVTRKQINDHLRDQGLFFPIDPGADASIGGMAATRASGTNAVRYGTMRENVVSLTAVMPDARAVRTARRARKSAAGYDLTRLLVGSEGTLGVITEVTLRLHGLPQAIAAAVCPFAGLDAACDTAVAAIQSGLPLARVELLDELQVRACNIYSKLNLAETPTLFVEFHGSQAAVEEQITLFESIARDHGGGDFQWSTRPEERTKLWQARHDAAYSCMVLRPGAKVMATDVCVPISRLAECVTLTKRDLAESGLFGPIVGHVGDGNFHVAVLFDGDDAMDLARMQAFCERLAMRAIAMDGTCTGEHGVGQGKMAYLAAEFGPALDLMRQIKRAIDPDDIMNPGKIFTP
ncbi:MAG: FAD-binding protein [Proteobacteria bacterium]|nr:FAD-binding protein [Pseudomonadota bacterium]